MLALKWKAAIVGRQSGDLSSDASSRQWFK